MSEYQNHGYPLQRMNVTTIKAQLRQFGIAHHPNDSKSRIVQLLEKHYAVLREQHGRNSKVYLQPDFDIGTYQVAHMRQILSQYDVAVHASASKEEVTRIFEHNIGHLKSMNARVSSSLRFYKLNRHQRLTDHSIHLQPLAQIRDGPLFPGPLLPSLIIRRTKSTL